MKTLITLMFCFFGSSAIFSQSVIEVLPSFADCEGNGGGVYVTVDSPYPYQMIIFNGSDTTIGNSLSFAQFFPLPPGPFHLAITVGDGVWNVWDSDIVTDCFVFPSCAGQIMSTNGGSVHWFADSVYMGLSDTLLLDTATFVQAYSEWDSTEVFGLLVTPFAGAGVVTVDDSCANAMGYVNTFTNFGWGNSPTTYLWSTGDTTLAIFGLIEGTYTVTITNGSGCVENLVAVIDDPCTTVGMTEQTELTFSMFPNPATNELTITGEDANGDILIYNSVGQIVHRMNRTSTQQRLDLSNLSDGQYFVSIRNEDRVVTKQLIIAR